MCELAKRAVGRVYLSVSRCIYQNLAFEEFLFRRHDLEKRGDCMFLWSNRPAVVIGRHQNPWIEANLDYLQEHNIDLARRHSGGGAVYHDLGNINISLLTSHKSHCRPRNLEFLANVMNKNYNLQLSQNKRHDLLLEPGSRKCSGTAARISRGRAYHHLTLLVDCDLQRLSRSLKSPVSHLIQTNATPSVRASAVGFLKQDDPSIDVDNVKNALINGFSEKFNTCDTHIVDIESEMIGNHEIVDNYNQLRTWDWVFGKTPKFTYCNGSVRQDVERGLLKMETRDSSKEELRFKVSL